MSGTWGNDSQGSGHSWSSIRKYSLSEIGIFYKTVHLKEREEKAENLSNMWMGSNLNHEGLQKVVSSLSKPIEKEKVQPEEINKDWKRLASFMRNQK